MDELNIQQQTIGAEEILKLLRILQEYKSGKKHAEQRIISAEEWWKLRNNREESKESTVMADNRNFRSRSGWLHNVITSKHADAMEAYPAPVIRPREPSDKEEAKMLSAIIPVILEQNDFEQVYDELQNQKLKFGTGIYKITWDAEKLNGLGDIAINRVNPLSIYTEPGVEDIQRSKYFFHTELVDKDVLEETYPELKDKLTANSFVSSKFLYDDSVSEEKKATVIDCYYHKNRKLHYVKFVGSNVIYATENDPQRAETGLYDHGLYPYIFDTLYRIEGSPYGYGYVDLCKNPQEAIDMLDTSFVRNAMVGAIPRYFSRQDGGVNEEEFLDLNKAIIHVPGNLGEDDLRQVNFNSLDGVYVNLYDRKISELRETSGNTETSTGNATSGVTAASAIAALQEASGKGSRDSNKGSYRAYTRLEFMVIELIRQFYDKPRQFRITGENGADQFVSYTNTGLQPQYQGQAFGIDLGYRTPVFDISCAAQRKSSFTTVAQNELAIQFYQLGFFNPQNADQALMTMGMMDFDGKDELIGKISQQQTMFKTLVQYQQLALQLAARYEPGMVQGLSQDIMSSLGTNPAPNPAAAEAQSMGFDPMTGQPEEAAHMQKARAQAQEAAAPDGGSTVSRKEM